MEDSQPKDESDVKSKLSPRKIAKIDYQAIF